MSSLRNVALALALATASTAALPAWADTSDKAYVMNVRKARTAMDKGKFDAAVGPLEKALGVADAPEARMLLAECLVEVGRSDDAIAALAPLAGMVPAEAATQFRSLVNKAGEGAKTVSVTVDAGTSDADIYVDGKLEIRTPRPVSVKAGYRTFKVQKAGFSSAQKEVLVMPGLNTQLSMPISATTGKVRLRSDTEGVSATVNGQTYALTPGNPQEIELSAGPTTVVFSMGEGEEVTRSVTVTPSGIEDVAYLGFGTLKLEGIDGPVKLTVGEETFDYAPGSEGISVPVGETTLLVVGEGRGPVRGPVVIEAGKTTTVTVPFEPGVDQSTERIIGWTTLGTGFALVLATVIVEETVDFDDGAAHDAVIWGLAGAGTALTITGGVLLREAISAENNPTVKDVNYGVNVSVLPTRNGGAIAAGFTF
jgi:hypothetical protein